METLPWDEDTNVSRPRDNPVRPWDQGAGLLQETRRRQQLLRDKILATRLRQQSLEIDGPLQATRRRQQILQEEIESMRLRRVFDDEIILLQDTHRRQQILRVELEKARERQETLMAELKVAGLSVQTVLEIDGYTKERAVAFCMGTHMRLGEVSPVSALPDLVIDKVVRLLFDGAVEKYLLESVSCCQGSHDVLSMQGREEDNGETSGVLHESNMEPGPHSEG